MIGFTPLNSDALEALDELERLGYPIHRSAERGHSLIMVLLEMAKRLEDLEKSVVLQTKTNRAKDE